ncbi:unnamed protein product, partial [Ixodes pacificus]
LGKSKTRPSVVAVPCRSVACQGGSSSGEAATQWRIVSGGGRRAWFMAARATGSTSPFGGGWGCRSNTVRALRQKGLRRFPSSLAAGGAGPSPAAANGGAATGSCSPASPGAAVLPIAAATRRERAATTRTPPRRSPDEYDADMTPPW